MNSRKTLSLLALFSSVLAIPAYAQHGVRGGHVAGYVGGYRVGGTARYYGGHYYRGYYGGPYGYYGGRPFGPRVYFGFGSGYPYYGYYPYFYGYPYYYGYRPYPYGYYLYHYGYPTYPGPPALIPQSNWNSSPPQGSSTPPYSPKTQPQLRIQHSNTQEQNYYLIAFTNDLIEAATAYKVEDDQIQWISQDGRQKQAPLSTVDVRFSRQINPDRGAGLKIPQAHVEGLGESQAGGNLPH